MKIFLITIGIMLVIKNFIIDEEIVCLRKSFKAKRSTQVSVERVFLLRNKILGVGCRGVINNLFQILYDSERSQYFKNAA